MKNNRRVKRMTRARRQKSASLNLVSLMDVFTILVFFLLVNSSSSEVLEPPKEIELPDSIVETKPRETVVLMITDSAVLVQGDPVISLADLLAAKDQNIEQIQQRLVEQQSKVIGIRTQMVAKSKEITILADRDIPFRVLKKVMSSCTAAGYQKISLAVNQKAAAADGASEEAGESGTAEPAAAEPVQG